jgi:hypothetical protein
MDYKNIIKSIPHNQFHLNRYIKFMSYCESSNSTLTFKGENHHILPKSLFPEYKNLRQNGFNKIHLTYRQHYIAHVLLAKAFPDSNMTIAVFMMSKHAKKYKFKFNSKVFAAMKIQALVKIRETSTGKTYKHTEEYKVRMSNYWKEVYRNNPKRHGSLGKKMTNIRKLHHSNKMKGWHSKNSHPKGMLGKNHTEKSKQLMSKQRQGELNPMYGATRLDLSERNKSIESRTNNSVKIAKRLLDKKLAKFGFDSPGTFYNKIVELTLTNYCFKCVKKGKRKGNIVICFHQLSQYFPYYGSGVELALQRFILNYESNNISSPSSNLSALI